MKLHKAKALFEEKNWLRWAISRTTTLSASNSRTLEEYIEGTLHGICFRPFERWLFDVKSTWHHHRLDLGLEGAFETVRLAVSYVIVYHIVGRGDVCCALDEPSANKSDTVRETMAKIVKHQAEQYPGEKYFYRAILRKKTIASSFGDTAGYDIFEIPEDWQFFID